MPLWGASDADESKPKWLTTADKKTVFATAAGWAHEAWNADMGNDNTSAQVEVLACVRGLTTSIGTADITEVEWNITTWKVDEGGTLSATVRFNEAVDISEAGGTTGVKIQVANSNAGSGSGRGPHTLRYASGTGTNEITFTLAIGAANAAIAADDVLSLDAQTIILAGASTVKDAGTSTDSNREWSSAIATAAGTITATAS